MKYKNIIGIILLLVAAFLLLFKYNEYKTTQALIDLYDGNVYRELELISNHNAIWKKYSQDIEDYQSLYSGEGAGVNYEVDEVMGALDEVIQDTKIVINSTDDYIRVLEENKSEYNSLKENSRFILGKRRKFINSFIQNLNDYYEYELANARESLIVSYGLLELDKRDKDGLYIEKFENSFTDFDDIQDVKENFYIIRYLQKYTDDDYTYEYEGKIKDSNEYLHEVIENAGEFYSVYYLFVEDIVNDDPESASYKFSTLERLSSEAGVDYSRVFREDVSNEVAKNIMRATIDIQSDLKNFEQSKLNEFPFMRDIRSINKDVVVCNFYFYKSGFYEELMGEYPEGENVDQLISTLGGVEPKSKGMDNSFNRSLMELQVSEEEVLFKCRNENGKTLEFFHIK